MMISQDCLSRKSRKEWSHCGTAKGSGSYPINRAVGQQCGSQQVLSIVVVLHTSQHLLSIEVFHCNFPLVHRRVLIVLTEPSPLIGCTRNHEQRYHPVQHCYPTFTVLFLFCCFFMFYIFVKSNHARTSILQLLFFCTLTFISTGTLSLDSVFHLCTCFLDYF